MGIVREPIKIKGGFPVFWNECKTLPGDFKLKTDLPEGTIVEKGTPILLDFTKMECKICKAIKVLAGGTTTKPRVQKGSFVAKGETIGGQAVNAIDSTSKDYDELTLAAAVSTATEEKILAVGSDVPNAVVGREMKISKDMGFNTVSAGYEVVILKDTAYPVVDDWLTGGFCLKNNPSIKYIRQ